MAFNFGTNSSSRNVSGMRAPDLAIQNRSALRRRSGRNARKVGTNNSVPLAARSTVATIEKKVRGDSNTLWFQGHWGFQYYMERIGGRAIDLNKIRVRSGDRVAIPDNNTNIWLPKVSQIDPSEVVTFQSDGPRFLTTMQTQLGAGFYSNVFGPLPFSFGHPSREGCSLVRFKWAKKP